MKIDIQDFFESISERQVYRVFRSFGYSSLVSLGLTRVCTRALHWQDRRLTKKVKRWQSKTEYKFSKENIKSAQKAYNPECFISGDVRSYKFKEKL